MQTNSKNEVLVVGSGIAGLAAAVAFRRQGLSVTVLTPSYSAPERKEGVYDARVYAISEASKTFLEELGVWGLIPKNRITPVTDMSVYGDDPSYSWDVSEHKNYQANLTGQIDMSAWQMAKETLTWIVESREIELALQQVWQVLGGRTIIAKLHALSRTVGESKWTVTTDSGERLQPDLLIGADGAQSPTRSLAQIEVKRRDYDHVGVITHLDAGLPHLGCARQWFTPVGVLALLPLPDTSRGPQVSMVWSLRTGYAQRLLAMPPEEQSQFLVKHLERVTEGCFGSLSVNSPLYGFPLAIQKAHAMCKPGLALVGDAAHLVHPLAGQGLNLGLGDVAQLAATLANKEAFRGIGDERVLARYQRQRVQPIWAMGATTDALYHLFYPTFTPFSKVRNLGMYAVDKLPWLKRQLISAAAKH